MFDYVRSQKTAHRLITKFGRKTVLRREVNKGVDRITGEVLKEERVTDCVAVFLPPKPGIDGGYADKYTDSNGVLNLQSVMDVLISPLGLTFKPEDLDQIINGDWWVIRGVTEVNPSGQTPVLYKGVAWRT